MYIYTHTCRDVARARRRVRRRRPDPEARRIRDGDHTDPPHPHPGNLLNMALHMIYTVIYIY